MGVGLTIRAVKDIDHEIEMVIDMSSRVYC